jgi:acyl-CoA synthetase (AMP-forming)/AMP-acid ligase II
MPGAGFLNLYGQTEVITSGLPRELHSTGHDPLTRRRMSSVGHPFPDTFVRIVDDTGSELPRGVPGEIVVRSPAMFRGYWNNSKATAETIRDGWCHTGDVGILDPDGLIRLVDRKKDVVVTGGENVYCPEVESAITRHPAIAACAVLGLPDSRWGEVVTAVVVAREESRPTLGELQAYLRDHLAAYKLPRRMEFIEELPVLPTGKVDKLALRAQYGAPTASNRA